MPLFNRQNNFSLEQDEEDPLEKLRQSIMAEQIPSPKVVNKKSSALPPSSTSALSYDEEPKKEESALKAKSFLKSLIPAAIGAIGYGAAGINPLIGGGAGYFQGQGAKFNEQDKQRKFKIEEDRTNKPKPLTLAEKHVFGMLSPEEDKRYLQGLAIGRAPGMTPNIKIGIDTVSDAINSLKDPRTSLRSKLEAYDTIINGGPSVGINPAPYIRKKAELQKQLDSIAATQQQE